MRKINTKFIYLDFQDDSLLYQISIIKFSKTFKNHYLMESIVKNLLCSLTLSVLVLYPILQCFAADAGEESIIEYPDEKLSFDQCEYPKFEDSISTYVFQGPITYIKPVDKSMDNYKEKNISLKISNFEYLLDPNKNITKGYISISQPNASSFNSINVQDTYTMCTNFLDNKPSKYTLVYIDPLHDRCIKEINLKGTTTLNPVVKFANEPKEFKLQLSGIPNVNATTELDALKEIKGLLKIGGSLEASIKDIVMDISCISS